MIQMRLKNNKQRESLIKFERDLFKPSKYEACPHLPENKEASFPENPTIQHDAY